MAKYITVTTSNIITQIAIPVEVVEHGGIIGTYSKGIIEVFLPDDKEWTDKDADVWIKENNKRMKAICDFLNRNNL
jgi:hypothetical protein